MGIKCSRIYASNNFKNVNMKLLFKGLYINYVGQGPEGFCGAHEIFRHILIGHEIFFKIFDGPQNIFLCSIFVILFFKLRRLEHKISKLAIKEI